MNVLHHDILIQAPTARVWQALVDLPAVQHYNPGVKAATLNSGSHEGIGASRRCEFKDGGWAGERITDWSPGREIAMEIYEGTLPFASMQWRTTLIPEQTGTRVSQELRYRMRFGVLGRVLDKLMVRRKLDQGISAVFAGLKAYVERSKI